ncbi:hypothetical protein AB1Y20_020117 [Prymnesium parvum]|uniref:Exostosin GT47 domain-containing protein n=1 Tax=Prymnesium parvum TaxID=97485 RepID=A0AB34JWG4_PRYPA
MPVAALHETAEALAAVERIAPVLRDGLLSYARSLYHTGFKVHLDYTCASESGLDFENMSLVQAWSMHHPNESIWWDKYGAEALIPHMIRTAPSVVTHDYREANASVVVLPVYLLGGTLLAPERCRRLLARRSEAFRATRGARHFFVLTADRGPCCYDGDLMLTHFLRHHVVGNHGELPGHRWRHMLAWRKQPPDLPCFDPLKDISFPTPLPVSAVSTLASPSRAGRDLLGFYVGSGLTATGLREGRAFMLKLFGNGTYTDMLVRPKMPASLVASGMSRAKYCMVMGGYAPWTPRLTQAIAHGCVPVICSSLLPPFSRALDWTRFSVRVGSLDELPRLRELLLQQDYHRLATGVAAVKDALLYNRDRGLHATQVLPFLLIEMSLAIKEASRCGVLSSEDPADCSLSGRADKLIGPLTGDGTPSYEKRANRKQYVQLLSRMRRMSNRSVEGLVVVKTQRPNTTARVWQCIPLVGKGHPLHIAAPFDPSTPLTAPIPSDARGAMKLSPKSCSCHHLLGPQSLEPWSTTQTTNRRRLRAVSSGVLRFIPPAKEWLDAVAPWLGSDGKVVFLNVGANKGYAAASMTQRYTDAPFTNGDWLADLRRFQQNKTESRRVLRKLTRTEKVLHTPCGACGACEERPRRGGGARELEVHAFELLDANIEWLQWAFTRFGVKGVVNQAVVCNESGSIQVPVKMPLGAEFITPLKQTTFVSAKHRWLVGTLEKLKLDDYVLRAGIKHAHIVSIDTEGYDALVLEGMRRMLETQAVDVLEFETTTSRFGRPVPRNLALWRRQCLG